MKKIISKQEEAKKQKRNQIIIGVILIVVMFGSGFGMVVNSFGNRDINNKITYNGFNFIKQDNLWNLQKGNFNFLFLYNPKQVQRINFSGDYINKYYSNPLYLSSDNNEASLEIYNNFGKIAQRIQFACFDENCTQDIPTKTCKDNFIIIRESNKTSITQQDNCVFIESPQENLTKTTDEFLFHIIGVRD